MKVEAEANEIPVGVTNKNELMYEGKFNIGMTSEGDVWLETLTGNNGVKNIIPRKQFAVKFGLPLQQIVKEEGIDTINQWIKEHYEGTDNI